jgi:hypothetical protein
MACLPRITVAVLPCRQSPEQLGNRKRLQLDRRLDQDRRSAPIARAVRSVSWHAVMPHDTATISVTIAFSLSRTASSTAISSNGFIDILTFAVSTPEPSGLTRTLTLKSTTRLTGTRTFIGQVLREARQWHAPAAAAGAPARVAERRAGAPNYSAIEGLARAGTMPYRSSGGNVRVAIGLRCASKR